MTTYKKLLMKQQRISGQSYIDVNSAIDTQEVFNVVCQEFPFQKLPEIKELAKRDWSDEDGEDVFIPTDGLKFQAYDMEVKFLYVGTEADMQSDINRFIQYLYGRNTNGSPLLCVYDEYTKTGRRGVYTQSVDNELLFYTDKTIDVLASFKVKFRVTDPVTDINSQLQPVSDSSSSD